MYLPRFQIEQNEDGFVVDGDDDDDDMLILDESISNMDVQEPATKRPRPF